MTPPDDRHPQLEGWGEWVRTAVHQDDSGVSFVRGVDMVGIYADHEQVRIDHDPDGTPRLYMIWKQHGWGTLNV